MADNFTATQGAGTIFAADEIGSVKYPRVKIVHGADGSASDASPTSPLPVGGAAADDAAASGNPVSIGAVYQATPDLVDDGDVGRLRMSARRALAIGPDFHATILNSFSVADAGGIEVSTAGELSGYGAPTTAFFNGADAGFGAAARYVRVPMGIAGFRDASIIFQNQLPVACQFTVKLMTAWDTNWLALYPIYDISVNAGGATAIAPASPGTGAVAWATVGTLASPAAYLMIALDPAADPASGYVSLAIARRA